MESGNAGIMLLHFKRDSDLDIMRLQLSWAPFQNFLTRQAETSPSSAGRIMTDKCWQAGLNR